MKLEMHQNENEIETTEYKFIVRQVLLWIVEFSLFSSIYLYFWDTSKGNYRMQLEISSAFQIKRYNV